MAKNRYIKDYRIVETVNERGRIRSDYEYIGQPYYFVAKAETISRVKKTLAALCVLAWIAWICAMLPDNTAMRTWYVSFPFAFAAIPLFLMADLALPLLRLRQPMEHRTADKLENRWPPRCLAAAILSGLALLGEAVNLMRGLPMKGGDGIFTLCALLVLLCSALCFRERKTLACRKGN